MLFEVSGRENLLCLIPPRSVGAEIGVHLGEYSKKIIQVARPTKLFLIDPWVYFSDDKYEKTLYGGKQGKNQEAMDERYHQVCALFANHIKTDHVQIIRDYSINAATLIKDGSLDFVYIDGDHSYEGVTADIDAYFPKLKVGGLLMGDDYSLRGWWKDGVVRAVHGALQKHALLIKLVMDDQFCLQRIR